MAHRYSIIVVTAALSGSLLTCAPSPTVREVANKEVVLRFADASNNRDFEALDELITENFVRHSQATPDVQVESREEFKEFLRQDAEIFPDSKVELEQLVAEGDLVAFLGTYKGTQTGRMGAFPASGKELELEIAGMFRLEEGKLAELWVSWDNLAALTQLGHFPPNPEIDSDSIDEEEGEDG